MSLGGCRGGVPLVLGLVLVLLAPLSLAFNGFEHVQNGNDALGLLIDEGYFANWWSQEREGSMSDKATELLTKAKAAGYTEDDLQAVRSIFGTKYLAEKPTHLVFTGPTEEQTPITYGHIVALGGDFFSYVGKSRFVRMEKYSPLCALPSSSTGHMMFEDAVDNMIADPRISIPGIVREFGEELKQYKGLKKKPNQIVETAMFGLLSRGKKSLVSGVLHWMKSLKNYFSKDPIVKDTARQVLSSVHDSPYIEMLNKNNDHFPAGFAHCGIKAYKLGHMRAVQVARGDANLCLHFKSAPKRQVCLANALRKALAINAFADHFLSDMSSAGHVRTPIVELRQSCGELAGGLNGNVAHDEDNKRGVLVKSNVARSAWVTYGDGKFMADKNTIGRREANKSLAKSIEEVILAFLSPRTSGEPAYEALDYTPHPARNALPGLWKLEHNDDKEHGYEIHIRHSTCVDGAAHFEYKPFSCASVGFIETIKAAKRKFGKMTGHSADPCKRDKKLKETIVSDSSEDETKEFRFRKAGGRRAGGQVLAPVAEKAPAAAPDLYDTWFDGEDEEDEEEE